MHLVMLWLMQLIITMIWLTTERIAVRRNYGVAGGPQSAAT